MDSEDQRDELLEIWDEIHPMGDPFHCFTLAHYLADIHDDPAQALIWGHPCP
jgi:hypothetical protein